MNLKEEVLSRLDPVDFYKKEFPDWTGDQNDLQECPRGKDHMDGEDSTHSLQINPVTGEFLCRGCGFRGTSSVGYYCDVHCNGNIKHALKELYEIYVGSLIKTEDWKLPHQRLLKSDDIISSILSHRGWTEDTIRDFKLGWSSSQKRVTIPIFTPDGLCVDMRYHDTIRKSPPSKNGKRIPMLARKGGRTGDWFPVNPKVNPLKGSEIWIVEGEPDAILANQDGIPALTLTGGASVLSGAPHATLRDLEGKRVVLCLDSDKAGQRAAEALSQRLTGADIHSLKNVQLPLGKDLTEYFLKYQGSAEKLRALAENAPYIIKPKDRAVAKVSLHDSSSPEHMHKVVSIDVLVNGMSPSPITIPKRLTIRCNSPERCANCPCVDGKAGEHIILKEDPEILKWVYSKDFNRTIKEDRNLLSKCPVQHEIKEWQSIQPVTMIPSLTDRESDTKYVARRGYYIGHGLESNQNYRATATPTAHPQTKENVLLLYNLVGSSNSITDFKLSEEDIRKIKEVFSGSRPRKILSEVSESHSSNTTLIYNRKDLHVGVDLCFHSVREFDFLNHKLRRASLDIALFGDTRCGKGQVAERISELYDLGSTISGENASFMGLVGGAQKNDSGFDLVWGRIPTSDGRLLIIDEVSGLQSMSQLSRVRSEGIAEIDKGGIHATTSANTRLIWIANPKKGRALSYYPTGVEGFADFIGPHEDIARFDLVIFAAKDEVSVEEINSLDHSTIRTKYTPDILRKIVLWAWSRKRDHVSFTDGAVKKILEHSTKLSHLYSSSIPLIQGENVRFKIAKIAAAIAARCFSSPDGVKLVVDVDHVDTAVWFMELCYRKPAAGYYTYSEGEAKQRKLVNVGNLEKMFEQFGDNKSMVIDGMLNNGLFGLRDLQDWTAMDSPVCKRFVGIMVRSYAIRKIYGQTDTYKMMPEFRKWLRKHK